MWLRFTPAPHPLDRLNCHVTKSLLRRPPHRLHPHPRLPTLKLSFEHLWAGMLGHSLCFVAFRLSFPPTVPPPSSHLRPSHLAKIKSLTVSCYHNYRWTVSILTSLTLGFVPPTPILLPIPTGCFIPPLPLERLKLKVIGILSYRLTHQHHNHHHQRTVP